MQIIRWGGAAALGVTVGLALAAPGYTQDEGHFPTGGWALQQVDGGAFVPATASTVVDATTVELTKPDGATGTSMETTDLGLNVAAGQQITVDYEMSAGALPDAGAVRLFWYDAPDSDTMATAPTALVAAGSTNGTLTIDISEAAKVGTLGLVYDASNPSAGTVRFSGLEVAGVPILFEAPTTPTPTSEPTTGPEPTEPPAAGKGGGASDGGAGGQLPVTGGPVTLIGAGALVLLLVGAGLYLLARRRRVSFTA